MPFRAAEQTFASIGKWLKLERANAIHLIAEWIEGSCQRAIATDYVITGIPSGVFRLAEHMLINHDFCNFERSYQEKIWLEADWSRADCRSKPDDLRLNSGRVNRGHHDGAGETAIQFAGLF